MNARRRSLLRAGAAGTAMLAASAAGSLLRPRELLANQLPAIDLAASIPNAFGDWRQLMSGAQAIVNPQAEAALRDIYSQLLSRTYLNTRKQRAVMLAIAYGRNQSDTLAVHLPDICYPSQGFEVREARHVELDVGTHRIPARQLMTEAPRRPEPLTYWTTVGERTADGGVQRKLVQMRYGLRGLVPDGLIFRVSSVGSEPEAEFRFQLEFVQALLKAVPDALRPRLVGEGGGMNAISREKVLPVARDVSVIVFAALVLAFATMLGWQALVFLCAVAAAMLFFLLQHTRGVPRRDWLLLFVLGGLLFVPTVERLSNVSVFAMWQPALMLLSVLGLARFAADVRESGWLRLALAFFLMYLLLGIASSIVSGRTRTAAGLYQFLSDLKPMLLVILGYALLWDERTERGLWFVVRWAWLPLLVCVAFEWLAPGTFFNTLYRGRWGPSPSPFGLFPSRAVGLFDHPSFLATISALFALLVAGRACSAHAEHRGHALRWVALGGIYGVLLLCSVQRQEMGALAVALAIVALLSRPDRLGRRLVAIGLVATPIAVALVFLLGEHIDRELANWGVGGLSIESPRAQIFTGAFEVAERLWPFGSGLGTYGGAGAEKFDQTLYHELGFREYWWFGKFDFLMDTYWPNPIAEKGFLGAACLLLCYLGLFFFAAKRALSATHAARVYWLATAGMMVYMLLLSFTSPAFQDPRLFLVPAVMFGIASQWGTQRTASEEKHRLAPREVHR